MLVKDIDILPEVKEHLIKKEIVGLNPVQELAVEAGVLKGKSMIVSAPTASGKTLVATLAIARLFSNEKAGMNKKNLKALYIVPLKALASEKYTEYKELFEGTGVKVAMSVGDKDSSDSWLESKNVIVMTSEKLDSVMRHNPIWVKEIALVVVDEIHLLNDVGRGPTLEVVITRLKDLIRFQLLGLSATIKNSKELAEWLNCELIESDYRPVQLKEGVLFGEELKFYSPSTSQLNVEFESADSGSIGSQRIPNEYNEGHINLINDTLKQKKQALVFVNSRRSAESVAEKASVLMAKTNPELEGLAEEVKKALSTPTAQCKRLATCVRKGFAFHHAGLVAEQRHIIEDNFRRGKIKCIVATPTLAMGVSLPSYRVIIRDLKRYTPTGYNYIPVLEFKQMSGRAGRPEHHSEGEAISIANTKAERKDIVKKYIFGEPEEIYSKLALEPVLRTHVLSLIATSHADSEKALLEFFLKSFYAHQYKEISKIKEHIRDILNMLAEFKFIVVSETKKGIEVKPTSLGKRVAELYIDPVTAFELINAFKKASEKMSELAYLMVLCNCLELRPLFTLRKNEYAEMDSLLESIKTELLQEVPEPWDIEYDEFLRVLKTATVFYGWINEIDEDQILKKGVTPGILRTKIEILDWLIYSAQELCTLKDLKYAVKQLRLLRMRIKYGIKPELLPLVKIKDIGKVRARKLYRNGIKTPNDIRNVPYSKLRAILGKNIAKKVKETVGERIVDRENITDYFSG